MGRQRGWGATGVLLGITGALGCSGGAQAPAWAGGGDASSTQGMQGGSGRPASGAASSSGGAGSAATSSSGSAAVAGSSSGAASASSSGAASASSSGATSGASSGAGGSSSSGSGSGSGSSSGAKPGSGSGGVSSSGSTSGAASGSGSGALPGDAGTGCPNLTGVDAAYARWPMPNPASQALPNPSSYTDNGDGTVRDNVTGLVWQKVVASAQSFAWTDAQAYCAGLTLAGRTWRLPSRIELTSLIDFTKNPGIDATAFPGTPGGKFHWTSTVWVVSQIASKPQDAWIVNFSDSGLTSNGAAQTAVEYARCVSSPAAGPLPMPLYVQVGPGEVEDVQTRLVWTQATNMTAMTPSAAATYCSGLAQNGHTWRLPSIKELATLVNDNPNIGKVSPAIDQCVFADTPANAWYISSSAVGSTPWAINYQDGFTNHSQTSGTVRCVH
ncbi:MAG: DUF1566 domain-containing protein [Myxococcales bacterium]|nr:DUF1566 domain-containing protein [Myxococcales bacterium]